MLELTDLGLTPRQYSEVIDADQDLVQEWLEKVSEPGVSNPTAWFLTGLRSGEHPEQQYDRERARKTHLAERWMANVGLLLNREEELLDELFGKHGLLREYAGDVKLQKRMISLWAKHRPDGEQTEREQLARAEQNKTTYYALRAGREER